MADEIDVDAGEPVIIRAMIDSGIGRTQKVGLAFEEQKWQWCNARCPRSDRQPRRYGCNGGGAGGWVANGKHFTVYESAKRD